MVPREFRSCRRLRPKRPMASFYDTAPTRFGIGPLFPRRTLPAECFPSPPVPELCDTLRLRLSTRRNRQFAGLRILVDLIHDIGLTGNFRPRISVCASISLSGLVSLLRLSFLLCLPRQLDTQPRWFRQECSLPISLAAERVRFAQPRTRVRQTTATAAAAPRLRRALRADRTLRRNSTQPFSSLT